MTEERSTATEREPAGRDVFLARQPIHGRDLSVAASELLFRDSSSARASGVEALPAEHLLVRIESGAEASERRLTFVAMGERYRRVLDGLAARRGAQRV